MNLFGSAVVEPDNNHNAFQYVSIWLIFYSFFFAASFVYVFAYVVIYAAIIGLIFIPPLKETFQFHSATILSSSPIIIFTSIGIFYILQRRELKRFFEKEEAVKKEQ